MRAPLLVIPLALEWVILITTVAPVFFVNQFDARPRLGIVIWFGAFFSAGIAMVCTLGIAAWGYFDTLNELNSHTIGDQGWLLALAMSFVPWAALAASGIALALINQRLEPLVIRAQEVRPLLDGAKTPLLHFLDVPVSTIELPFAYAVATNKEIILSNFANVHLSADELTAVLWHEYFHVKKKHFALKKLARLIRAVSPRIAASQLLVSEVDRLIEIAADSFALKHTDRPTLNLARSIFQ